MKRRVALHAGAALGAGAVLARTARGQATLTPQTPPTPSFSDEARRRLMPGSAAERQRAAAERQRLLDEAEAHLEAGRAAEALETLQRAAMLLHAPDTELAIVRAQMAAGEYRRALAFCAHAAGAHRDQPAGMALYAWLLQVGGQAVAARRFLGEALERRPDHPVLIQARDQLRDPWPLARAVLLQRPWRAAPYAHADEPDDSRGRPLAVVGTGLLLADGASALISRALVDRLGTGTELWLRNGLGRTVPVAQVEPSADDELARAVLGAALPAPKWQLAAREPFAGSPGSLIEYAADRQGEAAWPLTRQGFFAGVPGTLPTRPLGLDAPAAIGQARAAPVFDIAGRLAGVAVTDRHGVKGLVGVGRLGERFGTWLPMPAPPGAAAREDLDLVYERALAGTLQVLMPADPGAGCSPRNHADGGSMPRPSTGALHARQIQPARPSKHS